MDRALAIVSSPAAAMALFAAAVLQSTTTIAAWRDVVRGRPAALVAGAVGGVCIYCLARQCGVPAGG